MNLWLARGKGGLSGPTVGEGEWTCGERGGRGLCGLMVREGEGGVEWTRGERGGRGGLNGPVVGEGEGGFEWTHGGRG